MTAAPRAVLVHRRSEREDLLDRHATRGQLDFFLRSRGRSPAELDAADARLAEARRVVRTAVPASWRSASVERADLARFLFEPQDVVLVVGQDGLVANVAKYLTGQPVLGVDPDPGRNPGVLVTHRPERVGEVLAGLAAGRAAVLERRLVLAELDDGQRLTALNEIYVGQPGHQSSRYTLALPGGATERQCSSGIIVGTGTGATGWCRSIARERVGAGEAGLPEPAQGRLAWFVREAWPSPVTGTALTGGLLGDARPLEVRVESDALVAFGDGMERDRLTATWGQTVRIGLAPSVLRHVV